MPEKIRTSPAPLPVIHRKDQAALVLEDDELLDELLDEESFEADDDLEDSDDEDDELLEPDEDDDSDFAGSEPLLDERLSVR
jgi:hypothetical protein